MPITTSPTRRRAAGFARFARFARCLFAKSRLLAAAAVIAAAGNASAQFTWTPRDSSRAWRAVASSADGVKLVAAQAYDGANATTGKLYTSTDSGQTWSTLTAAGSSRQWSAVACSSDGTKILAADETGGLSTWDGTTWTNRNPAPDTPFWRSVASSANGQKLVAVSGFADGKIWTSSNSGATWTARSTDAGNPTRWWTCVTCDSTGNKIAAAEDGGRIYTSTDGGATWTPRATDRAWVSIASSADGTRLVAARSKEGAADTAALILTSSDSGATWTDRPPGGTETRWSAVTISGDGTQLAAVAGGVSYNGQIYTIAWPGSGIWSAQESARHWTTIASSSNGQKLVAAAFDGQLYTGVPTPVNSAPTLTAVGVLTGASEDTPFTITYAALAAAANEADADAGTTLSFRVEAVSTGTLTKGGTAVTPGTTLLSTGESLVWTPAANANGTLNAFTIKAWDGALASATAVQVQVSAAAVNDAPALTVISVSGTEDTPLNFTAANFTGAYSDPESTPLASITVVTLPATGTLKLSAANVTANQVIPAASLGNLNYVPAANENGAKTFTVTASDGSLSSTPATTVTMTLAAVNDAPALTTISVSGTEDTPLNFTAANFTGAYSDTESTPLASITVVTLPATGTLKLSAANVTANQVISAASLGNLNYVPAANENGAKTFTVTASDGSLSSTPATTVTMTLAAVNDAPVANAQSVSTSQNTAVNITLTGSDPENSPLTFSIVTNPTHGTVSSGTAAARTYTPTAGYSGPDSFTFKVNDNSADSAPATVSITVGAPNQPPSFTLPKVPEGLWEWGAGLGGSSTTPQPMGTASDWQSLACGDTYTVAVKRDGTLYAWGENHFGQLGLGNTTQQSTPQQVGIANDWQSVACGLAYTVALKRDGTLYGWGRNDSGQLGNGSTTDQNTPRQVGTDSDWQSVACGAAYTVAVKRDGTLYAWGNNNSGQLGLGNTQQQNTPRQVGIASDWQSAACGYTYTVAVKRDGTLYAWGANFSGQLGLGNTTQQSTPQRVGTDSDWQSVASGGDHTMAVKRDGTLYAWGENHFGQLGLGNTTQQSTPQQVGIANDWQSVACGFSHTVALKRDGELWAWGDDSAGQLGNGADNSYQQIPQRIGSDMDWQSVACGFSHTVALKRNSEVTWGKDWGPRTIPSFVTNINTGGEAGQTVSFTVTTDNLTLFPVNPTINPSGTLTFTAATGQSGDAVVTVFANDGATSNNTSPRQTFTIRILANAVRASDYLNQTPPLTTIDLVNKVLINDTGAPVTLANPVTMGGNSGLHALPGQGINLTGPITYGSETNLDSQGENQVSGCAQAVAFIINFIMNQATITTPNPGPANTSLTTTLPASGTRRPRGNTGTVTPVPGRVTVPGQGEMTACSVRGTPLTNTLEFAATSFAPGGTGPGTLQTLNATWGAGVLYEFDINKADGTAGSSPGWDLWNSTGTFTLVPVSGEKHWISLRSRTTANVPGEMAAFNKNAPYAWKIVSATGGITGFSPDLFALDTSGIRNDFGGGSFGVALQNSNRDLVVTYTPALRMGNWTSDATSGIDASAGTLWARRFGTAANATINGVTLTGTGFVVSSPEFDLAGPTANYNIDDVNALTTLAGQGSAEVAKRFVYGGNPATLTFKQLTPGYTYTATILTVGFDTTPNFRLQTFTSGTDSRVLDPNVYGDNAGNRIDYTFTADAATRTLTITPQTAANTIAIYGVALRRETLLPPVLSAVTASGVTGSAATLNATVTAGDARAPVLRRGFVIAATADNAAPELNGPGVTDFPVTGTTGAFSQPLTGLFYGTPYSFAAYAENEAGISYSSVVTFTAVDTAPVTGVSIAASSSGLGAPFDRAAIHCIDNSGLADGLHDITPDGQMWLTTGTFQTPNDPLPAEITFDMGSTVELNSIHVWNYNESSGFASRGCKDVTISVASSLGGAFNNVGNYTFAQAPGNAPYAGERIAFSRTNVRLVKFTINTNWGDADQFAGLSEVKFYKVLPSTDARLAALSISSGTLSPAFSPDTFAYTVTVPESVSSVTVTPTAVAAGSTISVANASVASGTASPVINLPPVGQIYLINIGVVAPSGLSINQYHITVRRVVPPPPPVPADFAMARNGANLGFTFTSATGRTYTLWRSDTLESGWTDTGLPAITGDGTVKTMTIPAPNSSVPRRYYRLQVQ